MKDAGSWPHAESRSVLWLSVTLAAVFSLLMLYMPYEFQGDIYRYLYPFLRPFGALFGIAAVVVALALADVGPPRWVGIAGQGLLLLALLGWVVVQGMTLGVTAGLISYAILLIGFTIGMVRPKLAAATFRWIYAALLLLLGGVIVLGRIQAPQSVYGLLPWWVDPMFLLPGLLQPIGHWQGTRRPWFSALTMISAAVPLGWYTLLWYRSANWLGMGVVGTLLAAAVMRAWYIWRPWPTRVPGLRRRILALALFLTVVPTLGLGAVAVYRVQMMGVRQSQATLREAVQALDKAVGAGGTAVPQLPPAVEQEFLARGLTPKIMPAAKLPPRWTAVDAPATAEQVAAGQGRYLVGYFRHSGQSWAAIVTQPAGEAYADATRTAEIMLLSALCVAALAVLLSLLLSNRLTGELGRLRGILAAIGEQRFQVCDGIVMPDEDELAQVSVAIADMAAALEVNHAEIQAQNEELLAQEEELRQQNLVLLERDRRLAEHARQQQVVAELGQQALGAADELPLIQQAVRSVAEVLSAACAVWGLDADGVTPRLQAAAGWEGQEPDGYCLNIQAEGRTLGTFCVARDDCRWLSEDDRSFLQAVCNVLATAIERGRAYRRLTAEHGVAKVLADAHDLAETLAALLKAVCEPLRWQIGVLWEVDERAGVLRYSGSWGPDERPDAPEVQVARATVIRPDEGLAGRAWASGKPMWFADIAEEVFAQRTRVLAAGLRTTLCIPVKAGSQVVGVLQFFSHHSFHLDAALWDTMESIASQVGQYIERRRAEAAREQLLAMEQASNCRLAFLAEAASLLASSMDSETLVAQVARLPIPFLGDMAMVHTTAGDTQTALCHVSPEAEAAAREIFAHNPPSPAVMDAYGAKAFIVPNLTEENLRQTVRTDAHAEMLRIMGIHSYMVVPLTARGQRLGILVLGVTNARRSYSQDDLVVAENLAGRIALALENNRLYRKVQETLRRLEESHALLDTLIQCAPLGVAFLDRDLRFVRLNEALAKFNGLPVADHLGCTIRDVVPAVADMAEPIFRGVMETGEPTVHWELYGETRAEPGVLRCWDESIYPVRLPNGEVIGIGAIVADVTERKGMEEALRKSEMRLAGKREILELIATGRPLPEILQAVARFVEGRVTNSQCAIFLRDEQEQGLRCAVAPGGLLGEHASLDQAGWVSPVTGSDGETLGILALYSSDQRLPDKDEQESAAAGGRMASIAIERQRLEEGRVQKLHSLIEHMAEGVVAIDAHRRLLFVNSAATQLLGLPPVDLAQPLSEIGLPAPLAEAINGAAEPGAVQPERLTFAAGGVEIEAHISPVLTDLGRHGVIAVMQDVTSQALFRRLQDSFVANVSHELRGPLASLSATLEALVDGIIPEGDRLRYLRAMRAEMERLRRLSYEVVDLTCLDSGTTQMKRDEFSIGLVLDSVVDNAAHRCATSGVELTMADSNLRVVADYDRVHQVVANLVDNASRFTPAGGSIHLFATAEAGCVRVHVADSGTGIPPEHLPFIWERFYKVDSARTPRPGTGTGLGLAIVKKLVENMGGQVAVRSTPGEGSVFSFTLPMA